MIRVLIADDHGVVRDGLGRLVEALSDIELVGAASDGEEAVERARGLSPDVVLMDLDMPRLDGIEATSRIVAERPETAILVLTSFSDRPRILGAIEAGAAGYLLKDASSRGGDRRDQSRRTGRVAAGPACSPDRSRRALGARPARGVLGA